MRKHINNLVGINLMRQNSTTIRSKKTPRVERQSNHSNNQQERNKNDNLTCLVLKEEVLELEDIGCCCWGCCCWGGCCCLRMMFFFLTDLWPMKSLTFVRCRRRTFDFDDLSIAHMPKPQLPWFSFSSSMDRALIIFLEGSEYH
jgi:hypothetical protein